MNDKQKEYIEMLDEILRIHNPETTVERKVHEAAQTLLDLYPTLCEIDEADVGEHTGTFIAHYDRVTETEARFFRVCIKAAPKIRKAISN